MLIGQSANVNLAYPSAAVINLVLDMIIILLPMPVLWRLQMPTFDKMAISDIFSMCLM